jgi:cytochrome b6-f complex iron-sulfur subunit
MKYSLVSGKFIESGNNHRTLSAPVMFLKPMDRRKFLETVYAAGAGIAIAGSIVDITKVPKLIARTRMTTKDVREVPINITDNPELQKVGGMYHLELEDSGQDILVVHVSKDKYAAVDLKCTHRGCDVNYDNDGKKLVCPCHGSEFDMYGRVTKGPAQKPLNYYHAELKGDEVMVTVYGSSDPIPANSVVPAVDSLTKQNSALDSTRVDSIIKHN